MFLGVQQAKEHKSELLGIAESLGLKLDRGRFHFEATDLNELVRRIGAIAEASDRALSLIEVHRRGFESSAPEKLKSVPITSFGDASIEQKAEGRRPGLTEQVRRDLESIGLLVEPNPHLPVQVSSRILEVRRNGSRAALDIVAAKGFQAASNAISRTAASFQALTRIHYADWCFAVAPPESPALGDQLGKFFKLAAPESSRLISSDDAAQVIAEQLGADVVGRAAPVKLTTGH